MQKGVCKCVFLGHAMNFFWPQSRGGAIAPSPPPARGSAAGPARGSRRRGGGCGEGVSHSPPGRGWEGAVPLPRKTFDFGSQYGQNVFVYRLTFRWPKSDCDSHHRPISHRFRDIGHFRRKSPIFPYLRANIAIIAPDEGVPLGIWYRRKGSRMLL